MKNLSFRYSLLSLVVISIFLTSSCGDLSAIRTFSESAKVVSQKFPALSADLYGSCVRTYRLHFYQVADFEPIAIEDIDSLSSLEKIEAFRGNIPADRLGQTAIAAERTCREQWKKTDKMAAELNKVLINYMTALGALASDDVVAFKSSYDALSKSVVSTTVFKESQVNAGFGLARFLTEATANFYRRKKLRDAIASEDARVGVLSTALRGYVVDGYVRLLKSERNVLNTYYQDAIAKHIDRDKAFGEQLLAQRGRREERTPSRTTDRLGIISTKAMWDQELKKIDDRIAAAHSYGQIMVDISAAHKKLFIHRNDLNTKEMRTTLLGYAQEIETQIETFKKAF